MGSHSSLLKETKVLRRPVQVPANLGRSPAAEAGVTNSATKPFVILYATAHVGPKLPVVIEPRSSRCVSGNQTRLPRATRWS